MVRRNCRTPFPVTLALILVTLVPLPVSAQEFADLRAAWQKKNYAEAAKGFALYRSTNRPSADADYMLATSLCRTGEKAKGIELLRWMLSPWTDALYVLTPEWVTAVNKEVSVCSPRMSIGGGGQGPWVIPPGDPTKPGGTSVIILPPDALVVPVPMRPQ
jgi:hypothetical protein